MKRKFIDFVCVLLITQCYCWKAIEPETRRVYQFVAETAPPTPVQRVRLNITKVDKSSSDDLFLVDLSWAAPHRWNGVNQEGRFYSLLCEINGTVESKPFLEIEIPWDVSRLRESLPFPKGQLRMFCAMRPTNDIKMNGIWKYSQSVSINNTESSDQEIISTTEATVKINTNLQIMKDDEEMSTKDNRTEENLMNVPSNKKEMSLMDLLSAIHESTLIEEPFDQDEFGIENAAPILVTVAPNEDVAPFSSTGKTATFKDDLRPKKPSFELETTCAGAACLERDKLQEDSRNVIHEMKPVIDVKRAGFSNNTDDKSMNKGSSLTENASLESTQEDANKLLVFDSEASDPSVEFDVIEPSRSPDDKVLAPAEEDKITENSERDSDVEENGVKSFDDFDEETQKKIKEDYDNIEDQLRETLEVNGLKTPRKIMMSSLGFGIHDRLL